MYIAIHVHECHLISYRLCIQCSLEKRLTFHPFLRAHVRRHESRHRDWWILVYLTTARLDKLIRFLLSSEQWPLIFSEVVVPRYISAQGLRSPTVEFLL